MFSIFYKVKVIRYWFFLKFRRPHISNIYFKVWYVVFLFMFIIRLVFSCFMPIISMGLYYFSQRCITSISAIPTGMFFILWLLAGIVTISVIAIYSEFGIIKKVWKSSTC